MPDEQPTDPVLENLIDTVQRAAKYRHVSPDLIRRIGRRELSVRPNFKEAVKATKNKLHQVGGAYLDSGINEAKGIALLQEASASADPRALKDACLQLMGRHASTRERLPILEQFYTTVLADLPHIETVIDVACGLNPLALPWMPFAEGLTYYAYDIYADMVALINGFFQIAGVAGHAAVRDVVALPPAHSADLVMILKTLPCLTQTDKTAAGQLLDAVNAPYLLVSFPALSLGGRGKGMVQNYAAAFRELADQRNWFLEQFEFQTELAFLVETGV